ncbi:tigger transposable element-derived protein 4-like [Diorhabda carinulata]|uniref:tigger transposable element-derived protein 4-like n=1 Tax=Diorhabda carinulata TaxID=1163345 RepID=UPI0025A2875B|nr:tigger transposable element-derived protein 4-like [Diorhabda carinulata]
MVQNPTQSSRESEEIISRSWVQRFCVRHAIVFKKLSGEAAGVPSATSDDWLSKVWPTIREGYSDSDVFNADETGLFYKLTPDRTLHFKGEKCSNGKISKERITVLVAANMSGSEKRKLFVIGKSKNPRCFKNVKNLPVDYYNNQKAWMTTDLFNKFLLDWDKELKKKRRKILLLIDNCPSHINLRDFEFIKVVFLPPNITSVLQPMDQGIIQKIKTNFRKQLVLRFLQDVEENRETKISIDIETDNGEEDEEEQLDIPPLTDALRAAQLLKKFVMCNTDKQNSYLSGLITVLPVMRSRPQKNEAESRLNNASFSYRVRLIEDGITRNVPVCLKVFLSLHGITGRRARYVRESLLLTRKAPVDMRGKHNTRPHRLRGHKTESD